MRLREGMVIQIAQFRLVFMNKAYRMRIYLFTKEWMQSAYVSFGDTLIFHHPHTKHVFIQLEPGKEDWNEYDSDCRLLGTLSLSTLSQPTFAVHFICNWRKKQRIRFSFIY